MHDARLACLLSFLVGRGGEEGGKAWVWMDLMIAFGSFPGQIGCFRDGKTSDYLSFQGKS